MAEIHEVARGQYVEFAREGEGAIWTVLGEFADLLHNNIPEPNRAVNNTTIWVPDFSRQHIWTCCSTMRPAPTRCATFTSSSPPTATPFMAM